MNGREATSSDARPSLKRSRDEEASNQAEEEEGLVALVKKRKSDVKLLVSRIATLEVELSAARQKLEQAESLLQAMQGPAQSGQRIKKEPLDPGLRHQNGHSEARNTAPHSGPVGVSAKATVKGATPDVPRLSPASPHHKVTSQVTVARLQSTNSSRDTSVSGTPAKSRVDNSGSRTTSDATRKDRKVQDRAPGGERSQEVGRCPAPSKQPEHVDLILTIRSRAKAQPVPISHVVYTPSRHKRKLRSLGLNPASGTQCATSALDGVVNFWQIHEKGLEVNFRFSVDCLSPGQRHWPEELTWHPDGRSIFAIYSADNGDSQVSIIKNDNKEKKMVKFLPNKPHVKGLLNGITFMPWSSSQFVTGGSDHMVHLWHEQDEEDAWKPTLLHANLHTSSVHGVAGTRHKQLVLSAGADKRVFGFDPASRRMTFKHELESKAMTVLPNTTDFNLFMVQTGQPSKQLHLFDIRTRTELHTFGWVQESSDTQSALITQSWSPDGYYIASGSVDPKIVIFDIRFNGREPAQTIYAHTKRIFMAIWHQTLPMLLSISSDYNIGVHKIN